MGAASIATVLSPGISVAVPARPRFVQILRAVISAVGAREDLGWDAIEDLKIGVDEASAQLLALSPDSGTLTLRVEATGAALEVVVSIDAGAVPWPPDGHERSLTWAVLTGLMDEARWERQAEGPALRLAKRVERAEAP
jgi:serine/threonine-protein kinase RsbW